MNNASFLKKRSVARTSRTVFENLMMGDMSILLRLSTFGLLRKEANLISRAIRL
jgi:hypothetical protein